MSTSGSTTFQSTALGQPQPAASRRRWARLRSGLTRSRSWIHRHPRIRAPYRVLVAAAGLTIIVVGLILVPLPGPGWLIVFLGVAVLGTEFPAAHRLTQLVRRQAGRVRQWWRARQDRLGTRAGTSSAA
ncbi:TIGR02611 family protein [Cryobacterium sp.]|uniref:TIGR02611 family protein n=1 Tax=Cryobacterium sp. TaxID=1926290 RepID=UPI0026041884|nr:TIGR02611 family protein [Cryobacterium sp.]